LILTDEELKVVSDKLTARLLADLGRFTVMLAILDKSDQRPQAVITNATGTLINTGAGQFLVTNDHVYRAFESKRAENPGIMLIMSGVDDVPFRNISEQHVVRGRDKDLDLAVLEVPVPMVDALGRAFYTWDSWPPRRPERGMAAIVFGYPGQGRVPMDSRLGVTPMIIGRQITSCNDLRFALVDTEQDAIKTSPEGASPLTRLGGMSGSGVYARSSAKEWFLAGFMYEVDDAMDIIYASYAAHIQADGTI
jgi:Trypsin-like peptidase domain